jgi:hypothetical protein
LPFGAFVFAAANIPFCYRTESHADLEANFLNAGVCGFWVWRKTRYLGNLKLPQGKTMVASAFFWGLFASQTRW